MTRVIPGGNTQEMQKGDDLFKCTVLQKILKGPEPSGTILSFYSRFFFFTKMQISHASIMQPFGLSEVRYVCAGATEKQCLGWDISVQDVLLKQLKSSLDFEQ